MVALCSVIIIIAAADMPWSLPGKMHHSSAALAWWCSALPAQEYLLLKEVLRYTERCPADHHIPS